MRLSQNKTLRAISSLASFSASFLQQTASSPPGSRLPSHAALSAALRWPPRCPLGGGREPIDTDEPGDAHKSSGWERYSDEVLLTQNISLNLKDLEEAYEEDPVDQWPGPSHEVAPLPYEIGVDTHGAVQAGGRTKLEDEALADIITQYGEPDMDTANRYKEERWTWDMVADELLARVQSLGLDATRRSPVKVRERWVLLSTGNNREAELYHHKRAKVAAAAKGEAAPVLEERWFKAKMHSVERAAVKELWEEKGAPTGSTWRLEEAARWRLDDVAMLVRRAAKDAGAPDSHPVRTHKTLREEMKRLEERKRRAEEGAKAGGLQGGEVGAAEAGQLHQRGAHVGEVQRERKTGGQGKGCKRDRQDQDIELTNDEHED